MTTASLRRSLFTEFAAGRTGGPRDSNAPNRGRIAEAVGPRAGSGIRHHTAANGRPATPQQMAPSGAERQRKMPFPRQHRTIRRRGSVKLAVLLWSGQAVMSLLFDPRSLNLPTGHDIGSHVAGGAGAVTAGAPSDHRRPAEIPCAEPDVVEASAIMENLGRCRSIRPTARAAVDVVLDCLADRAVKTLVIAPLEGDAERRRRLPGHHRPHILPYRSESMNPHGAPPC
jgi:hypothetical protein